jgi:hypothetical protein
MVRDDQWYVSTNQFERIRRMLVETKGTRLAEIELMRQRARSGFAVDSHGAPQSGLRIRRVGETRAGDTRSNSDWAACSARLIRR